MILRTATKIALFLLITYLSGFSGTSEQVVSVKIYSSADKFKPAESLEIAVEVTIEAPYHINSHKPSEDFLIPTSLTFKPAEGINFGKIDYPRSEFKRFSFSQKPLAVHEGKIYIFTSISISTEYEGNIVLLEGVLGYQPCDDYTCLAPEEASFIHEIPIAKSGEKINITNQSIFTLRNAYTDTSLAESLNEELDIGQEISQRGWFLTFILVFLGGLALNLTPCVYPLIPITISYFGGQAEGKKGHLVSHAIIYVIGMSITYSILGVLASLTGSLFGSALQNPSVLIVIAIILVGLALNMFNLYEIRVPTFLTNFAGGAKKGYLGTLFMGLTVGILAAPCIGPFVLALLTFVGERGDILLGFGMFFTLAIGLGIPFIFLAIFSGSLNKIPRSGAWMVWVRNIFGFVLMGMAIYFLQPLFPNYLAYSLTLALTMLIGGIYMAWIEPTKTPGKLFPIIRNVIGIMFFILALIFSINGIQVYLDHKFSDILNSANLAERSDQIRWFTYSEERLIEASQTNKPVMIDFYADWCIPCKELDKFTFSAPQVIEKSKKFIMLKVDLTKGNDHIRNKFNVKGVPTLVFLKSNGDELKNLRITGFIESEKFLSVLTKALDYQYATLSVLK